MKIPDFRLKAPWIYRILRKLFNFIPHATLTKKSSWQWLRLYPAVIPPEDCFNEWHQAENYPDYQQWINQHSLLSLGDWQVLQQQAKQWQLPPKISIVTPIYNTLPEILYECILSVRAQAYPYWQLILVDDGSTNTETRKLLKSAVCKDPRIQLCFNQHSQGISAATNTGIEKAQGNFVIFLDHDDRLSLDALALIAAEIQQHPEVDIVYSDRDMLSPSGKRFMHLFKPDWSPETLLAGNYIFHLMCYRHSLLTRLGGLRTEFDGSQDYDLILRAIETQPQVRHIQKVLYHWRQYQGSVSLDSGAKDYAFKAGVKALNEAMQRRGIAGKAIEVSSLWRGNYQLEMPSPEQVEIEVISVTSTLAAEDYTHFINQSVCVTEKPYIAIISQAFTPVTDNALGQLAAWLKIEGVALATGSIITGDKLIDYAGAALRKDGELLIPYQGESIREPGYMAVTQLTRNISAPHPFCVIIRRELWQQLSGLNADYQGFYGLLDFSLRALAADWRCVSVPQAQFVTSQQGILKYSSEQDKRLFCKQWQSWLLKGDPYYSRNLADSQDKLYQLPS